MIRYLLHALAVRLQDLSQQQPSRQELTQHTTMEQLSFGTLVISPQTAYVEVENDDFDSEMVSLSSNSSQSTSQHRMVFPVAHENLYKCGEHEKCTAKKSNRIYTPGSQSEKYSKLVEISSGMFSRISSTDSEHQSSSSREHAADMQIRRTHSISIQNIRQSSSHFKSCQEVVSNNSYLQWVIDLLPWMIGFLWLASWYLIRICSSDSFQAEK